MIYNREGGYWEKVRSYYLPGNSSVSPPAHRAHGIATNAEGGADRFDPFLFSARGSGGPEEGG